MRLGFVGFHERLELLDVVVGLGFHLLHLLLEFLGLELHFSFQLGCLDLGLGHLDFHLLHLLGHLPNLLQPLLGLGYIAAQPGSFRNVHIVGGNGLVKVHQLHLVDSGNAEQQVQIAVVQLDSLTVEGKALFEFLHAHLGRTQPNGGLHVIRLHCQHILVLLARRRIVQVVKQNRGQVESGLDILRVGFNGPGEVHHGLGRVTELEIGESQVVVGLGGETVQGEHLVLKNPPRNSQFVTQQVDKTARVERYDVARLYGEHILHKVLGGGNGLDPAPLVRLHTGLHQPV